MVPYGGSKVAPWARSSERGRNDTWNLERTSTSLSTSPAARDQEEQPSGFRTALVHGQRNQVRTGQHGRNAVTSRQKPA